MQERKKLNNPAQARNSFRQMVTGLILEQPFQIGSEHSLSHSEIAGGKRIYQHLSQYDILGIARQLFRRVI